MYNKFVKVRITDKIPAWLYPFLTYPSQIISQVLGLVQHTCFVTAITNEANIMEKNTYTHLSYLPSFQTKTIFNDPKVV